jgi:hypothetical protein
MLPISYSFHRANTLNTTTWSLKTLHTCKTHKSQPQGNSEKSIDFLINESGLAQALPYFANFASESGGV